MSSVLLPFSERAMATADNFALEDRDIPALLEIRRQLDGVPW